MKNKSNQILFAQKASLIHNSKYDYKSVKYINSHTKVKIICPTHSVFKQTPANHLNMHGCPKCKGEKHATLRKKSLESFIEESDKVHNNKYNYSSSQYINNSTKVKIICPTHDVFTKSPKKHLRGQGCPRCSKVAKSNIKEFIKKANGEHNREYDYSVAEYINNKTKVKIICPVHGVFEQRPDNHLYGAGCPKCKRSKMEKEWLDYMNIPDTKAYRNVRIDTKNKYFIVDGFDIMTNTIYEFYGDFWHGNLNIYDKSDYNCVSHKTFEELYNLTIKKEKELKRNGYNLITIWESDFKILKRS